MTARDFICLFKAVNSRCAVSPHACMPAERAVYFARFFSLFSARPNIQTISETTGPILTIFSGLLEPRSA